MEENQYRIGELAEKAGVTRRTIHYYMGRGLLPPPEGNGLGTTYSDEHLYRIMLIKKLQDAYLPLEEIKKRISGVILDNVKKSLEEEILHVKTKDQISIPISDIMAGNIYKRLSLGFGLEIHFPANNKKAQYLAEQLYQYAEKIMKEGI